MKDDYPNLYEGTITIHEEPIVTGRIEWLMSGAKYKGMKFHTDPLTAAQAHSIHEGPIELEFAKSNGDAVSILEGHIRADTPVREGAETTVLMAPDHGSWDLNL